ncbi:aldehyde dehydrogenase (NADP(+)) [Mycolicibacterium sp. 120266]|uniref:aldehyde dehydrogenase (NADP(+)) n=1 Tax=Mycolicibacterium sp. 120266 TaxID=3090601 RepID=UPI00299DB3D4|nr:aldehyde dehydrogenase (NADP(+)) [Mycolicibacterium sp. 120266]MDX1876152.1 aldehyde dehydrogenase (NADP(+)) [Mycolicibacterium sp. 120266]
MALPPTAVNPRTGVRMDAVAEDTSTAEVQQLCAAAAAAAPALSALSRQDRARLLDRIGDAIDAHRDELIDIATQETGFTAAKLSGEATRAAYQFRFFAEVIRDGGYLEASIDPAGDTPMGPRPDLRRWLIPIGPIAVFGASNFPFAFSVLGGDTASALAAGNPVIVKAHGSHPGTSRLSYELMADALGDAPSGTLGIVYGTAAGAALVADPAIKAVGFTGSLSGGKALLDIISGREEPIPFYGELSSLNPVVITPSAASAHGADIGTGLVASVTLGSGQLCTKPGFVLVPDNAEGAALVQAAVDGLTTATDHVLLNESIYDSYTQATSDYAQRSDVTSHSAPEAIGAGYYVTPALLEVGIDDLDDSLVREVFGPIAVIVRYPADNLTAAAHKLFDTLPSSLTATLHTTENDDLASLLNVASAHAGRILFGGFPTGVAVSWAQNHGGPWPATNTLHTSVGATAIRRFLRPLTYQNAPQSALPEELRDGYDAIPRRIDGHLSAASR